MLEECTTWQLLIRLHQSDWTHQVKDKDVADYVPGGEKIWYTRSNATRISRLYLLALLMDKSVKHFLNESQYAALIEGKDVDDVPRKRRRLPDMKFVHVDDEDWEALEKLDAAPIRKRSIKKGQKKKM